MTGDTLDTARGRFPKVLDAGLRISANEPEFSYASFVGRVQGPSPPTSSNRFFSVHPARILGREEENALGQIEVDSSRSVPVFVLGSRAPSAGDDLICRFIDNRWFAERGGRQGGPVTTIPGCHCPAIPTTLHMTSLVPDCNFGILRSCVITHGPTPSVYAPLSLGSHCFLSTQRFTSDYSNEEFNYLLTCNASFLSLSRLFPISVFGSPFREPPIYSWLINDFGNTCSPFLMSFGFIFFGGDPACSVILSE